MLVLDVFSEGKLCMVLMLLSRRSLQEKPAIVGQNGAAAVVDLKEIKEGKLSKRRRKQSGQSTEKHLFKYMRLRVLTKLKVTFKQLLPRC